MAVIIEERGRGKFKPAPDYAVDEVKELLNAKIEEERQAFADCSEEIDFDKLIQFVLEFFQFGRNVFLLRHLLSLLFYP